MTPEPADPLAWLESPGPYREPWAAALYRHRAAQQLEQLNPYYDEPAPLAQALVQVAGELREVYFYDDPAPETWQRYALALLNLAQALLPPESNAARVVTARAERLTNACTDLRRLAGIEPAMPPYLRPAAEEETP